jgi:ATP-dependent exoDNAse (exonuclease V) beta subunit
MELFTKSDLLTWTSQRLQRCQPFMQKWLMQQGHSIKHAEQGAVQVLAALNVTLTSEDGQWVLQNHNNAVSELSLLQPDEDGVKKHVIDRTFITGGLRWVVDYKLTNFNEVLSSDVDLASTAEQYRPQLERYAGLFANEVLPIKKAVLFLNIGKLVEL